MRKTSLILALALAALAAPAAADGVQDTVVAEMKAQGFTHIVLSRTLLGRLRILATNESQEREVIVNPRTGEILRDYTDKVDDDSSGARRGDDSFYSGRSRPSASGGTSSGSTSSGSTSSGSGGTRGSGSGSGSGSGGHDVEVEVEHEHEDEHDD